MVVWTSNGLYGMVLHPELSLITAPTRLMTLGDTTPRIAWQRGARSYLIVSGQFYLETRPPNIADYTAAAMPNWNIGGGPLGRTMTYDAVAVSETLSAVSVRGFAPAQTPCGIAGDCGRPIGPAAAVGVAIPHPQPPVNVDAQGGDYLPPTTVALLGEHALVAWLRVYTGFSPGFQIVTRWADRPTQIEATNGRVPWRSGLTAASEGDVILLVWQEGTDPARIFGVVMTRESMSEPFLIADGTTPSATALGDGRVLVVYDTSDRLAGRVVYLHAPLRRRAAR
jgi:hypothetical protein